MFETIKQNIQKYALLRAAVYIISGIAIVLLFFILSVI